MDNDIINWLIAEASKHPELSGVRFGTKKLDETVTPQPSKQVVVVLTEASSGAKAWQGGTTVFRRGLVLIHIYSQNKDTASDLAEFVCELLDGATEIPGVASLSINAWPREIEYTRQETMYYANADVLRG